MTSHNLKICKKCFKNNLPSLNSLHFLHLTHRNLNSNAHLYFHCYTKVPLFLKSPRRNLWMAPRFAYSLEPNRWSLSLVRLVTREFKDTLHGYTPLTCLTLILFGTENNDIIYNYSTYYYFMFKC